MARKSLPAVSATTPSHRTITLTRPQTSLKRGRSNLGNELQRDYSTKPSATPATLPRGRGRKARATTDEQDVVHVESSPVKVAASGRNKRKRAAVEVEVEDPLALQDDAGEGAEEEAGDSDPVLGSGQEEEAATGQLEAIDPEKELDAWQEFAVDHYEVVEQLPLELHRNYRLLRELDEGCIAQTEKLHKLIREYIALRHRSSALMQSASAEHSHTDPNPGGSATPRNALAPSSQNEVSTSDPAGLPSASDIIALAQAAADEIHVEPIRTGVTPPVHALPATALTRGLMSTETGEVEQTEVANTQDATGLGHVVADTEDRNEVIESGSNVPPEIHAAEAATNSHSSDAKDLVEETGVQPVSDGQGGLLLPPIPKSIAIAAVSPTAIPSQGETDKGETKENDHLDSDQPPPTLPVDNLDEEKEEEEEEEEIEEPIETDDDRSRRRQAGTNIQDGPGDMADPSMLVVPTSVVSISPSSPARALEDDTKTGQVVEGSSQSQERGDTTGAGAEAAASVEGVAAAEFDPKQPDDLTTAGPDGETGATAHTLDQPTPNHNIADVTATATASTDAPLDRSRADAEAAATGVAASGLLLEISRLAKEIVRNGEEKVAVAMGAYNSVDRHIRALDSALSSQEASILLGLRPSTHPSTATGGELLISAQDANDPMGGTLGEEEDEGGFSIGVGGRRGKKGKKARKGDKTAGQGAGAENQIPGTKMGQDGLQATGEAGVGVPPLMMLLNADPSEPRYCYCNEVSYGEMIGCDNDDCPHEWFHLACAGLTTVPTGKWLCNVCRVAEGAGNGAGGGDLAVRGKAARRRGGVTRGKKRR